MMVTFFDVRTKQTFKDELSRVDQVVKLANKNHWSYEQFYKALGINPVRPDNVTQVKNLEVRKYNPDETGIDYIITEVLI